MATNRVTNRLVLDGRYTILKKPNSPFRFLIGSSFYIAKTASSSRKGAEAAVVGVGQRWKNDYSKNSGF